jgi:hypothetical protein
MDAVERAFWYAHGGGLSGIVPYKGQWDPCMFSDPVFTIEDKHGAFLAVLPANSDTHPDAVDSEGYDRFSAAFLPDGNLRIARVCLRLPPGVCIPVLGSRRRVRAGDRLVVSVSIDWTKPTPTRIDRLRSSLGRLFPSLLHPFSPDAG